MQLTMISMNYIYGMYLDNKDIKMENIAINLSQTSRKESIMYQLKSGNGKRLLLVVMMMVGLFMLVSCTASQQQKIHHGFFMKGSIIHTTDDGVYLCIGSKDGAVVGQELDVYKITFTGQPKAPSFKREKTGKVKITEIVDEHFATAAVISGKAEKNDIVELTN